MATTVQVSEETRQALAILKDQEAMESYESVIRSLIREHMKSPHSMFGKLTKRVRMTARDKKEFFHEL